MLITGQAGGGALPGMGGQPGAMPAMGGMGGAMGGMGGMGAMPQAQPPAQ